jgi:dinuclear metal center YbgI/SA1388 family protein
MRVADLAAWLEDYAPHRLAESWDHIGLLWGDPEAAVSRIMTCLTVTPDTTAEAVAERADVIVSHHPILFRAVKEVRADRPEGAVLWSLARAGIAVLSPHTAFDNTVGGINDGLARRLGLIEVGPLRPSPPSAAFKVIVFAPPSDRDAVLDAMFAAGAGRIGAYEQCSFTTAGRGTFFGTEGTNPTIGQAGRREQVREWKLEVVCPADRLDAVLTAMRASHSYEEPAFDVIPLHVPAAGPGVGRLGRLPEPESLSAFTRRVARALACSSLQRVGEPDRSVARVAIACGAGDDFLTDAVHAGADVLLTGEARFHRALEARALGLGLVLAGHYATERPGVEDLADRLTAAFPQATIWASRRERDPLVSVPGESSI